MSAAVAPEGRAITTTLEEIAHSLGGPFAAFVQLAEMRGALALTPVGPTFTTLQANFRLDVPRPEALARRGITPALLSAAAAELLTAAHHRAAREARRRGLALSERWRVGGAVAKSAARQLREAVRAERREEAVRILLERDAAQKAKVAAPRPLTEGEREAQLVAEIVRVHRSHSGGASGAPATP